MYMRRKTVALALAAALLSGCGKSKSLSDVINEDMLQCMSAYGENILYDGSYTDKKLSDADAAISSLDGLGQLFGISDPEKELRCIDTYDIAGGAWYKLQQAYGGIPVYGRSITVMAGEDDGALGLLANTIDMSGAQTKPEMTEAEVRELLAETFSLSEKEAELAYYTLGDDVTLCYRFGAGSTEIFASAMDGAVVAKLGGLVCDSVAYTSRMDSGITVTADLTGDTYTLTDAKRNITICTPTYEPVGDQTAFQGRGDEVVWPADEDPEQQALYAMLYVKNAYDFFDTTFSAHINKPINGFIRVENVYDDDKDRIVGLSNNAAHFTTDDGITALAFGEYCLSASTACHEFTHGIVESYAGLDSIPESLAINEAIADIFAELEEADRTGACDWVHGKRNMAAPAEKYVDTYEGFSSLKDPHYNCTIVSRAACLMNLGGIGYDDLGQLWFRSLLLCSPSTNMHELSFIVLAVAGQMVDSGELSVAQLTTVMEAFTEVKLFVEDSEFFPSVTAEPEIYIMNKNQNLAVNVNLVIEGMDISIDGAKAVNTVETYAVTDPEPILTQLPQGAYKLTITGRSYQKAEVSYIVVRDMGTPLVRIETGFTDQVSGIVRDKETGAAIAGATVSFRSPDGAIVYETATTYRDGKWYADVADDDYQVTFTHPDYESGEQEVSYTEFPTLDVAAATPQAAGLFLGITELVPLRALPLYVSACIGEYSGVTYCTDDIAARDSATPEEAARLTKLNIEPAAYDYISSFIFYRGKLYYSCKESGTSDYRSAIYRCDPDGSNHELLIDSAGLGFSSEFTISWDKLCVTNSSKAFDIAANQVVELDEPTQWGVVPDLYNAEHVFFWDNGIYMGSYEPDAHWVHTDNKLVATNAGGRVRLHCATSDSLYYQVESGNTSYLYRYDIATDTSHQVDSRPSAGSGWYFNW